MRKWWGLVLLLLVGVGVWWWRQPGGVETGNEIQNRISLPVGVEKMAEQMGWQLSEEADAVGLVAVEGNSGSGLASWEQMGGRWRHQILADLPEPGEGYFYEGWLVSEAGEVIYTGKLAKEKGGWILDWETERDVRGYKVVVTLEKVDDQQPELHVLEGQMR